MMLEESQQQLMFKHSRPKLLIHIYLLASNSFPSGKNKKLILIFYTCLSTPGQPPALALRPYHPLCVINWLI